MLNPPGLSGEPLYLLYEIAKDSVSLENLKVHIYTTKPFRMLPLMMMLTYNVGGLMLLLPKDKQIL